MSLTSNNNEPFPRLSEERQNELLQMIKRKFISTLNLLSKRLKVNNFLYVIKEDGSVKTKMELPRSKWFYEDQKIDWENEDGLVEELDVCRLIQHSEATCLICYDEYTENSRICFSRNKQCKHHFHRRCLLKWLMEMEEFKTYCPYCQNEFNINLGIQLLDHNEIYIYYNTMYFHEVLFIDELIEFDAFTELN